jgi:hypothetical protein
MSTTINLSLVPFFPSTGLPARITLASGTVIDFDQGWIILDEERGLASGRLVVVCHNDLHWGEVMAITPNRSQVEVDLANFWTRQQALRFAFESLPGTPLYSDAPIENVRSLMLRATTALATKRVRTPQPATPRV